MTNKKKKKAEPVETLDRIVKAALVFIAVFVVVMIVTFWAKGSIPDTLVGCVCGAGVLELLFTTMITITKKKLEQKEARRGRKDRESDSTGSEDML